MNTNLLNTLARSVGDGSELRDGHADRADSMHPLAHARGSFNPDPLAHARGSFNPDPLAHARGSSNAAFTLIEVLIAVIIIGLGMIGISALFAGAARQQQIVSQSSRTTTAARNAESKVLELFSTLRDVNDVANCTYNGVIPSVLASEKLTVEWTPVFSDNDGSLNVFRSPANANPTNACTAFFFEKPLPEFALLDNADRFGTRLNSVIDIDGFFNGPTSASELPGMNPFFPVRSLVADTIEIDVYITGSDRIVLGDPEFVNPTDPASPPSRIGRVSRYTYAYDPRLAVDGGEGPCNGTVIRLRPKQAHPRFVSQGYNFNNDWRAQDFITIEAYKCPIERNSDNPEVAFIKDMKIFGIKETPGTGAANPSPRVGRYIQKIVVRNATYRTINLLSTSERVLTETTPAGDLKDVSAISVMMRAPALPDGSPDGNGVQVAVFTYSIQAAADNERFIPPEFVNTPVEDRPIRSALVELVYNRETESYWFFCIRAPETPATDESWLARSGQTPLFAGDQGDGVSGADDASRVVRVVTLERNQGYWCELEKAPRAGTSIVGPGTPRVVNSVFSPVSAPGAPGNRRVFAVANQAVSGARPGNTSSGATWRLTPIGSRVFTISR
ncbi:MAG: prepilin-type N-terminal cleavage/methylation domain-containing protein [Phycisphaerales bacterium]